MDRQIISLKIKDGDPLLVLRNRLTAKSKVFRYLIDELNYNELEMDDFSPEAVNLFITILLEEFQRVILIPHDLFRDTHKLAVVFEVKWIKKDCQNLLREEMKSIKSYEETCFLFDECYYIFAKWKNRNLIDSLMLCLVTNKNSLFISKYMSDLRKVETGKLDLLLILGGSNTDLFLNILINNLKRSKYLGGKVKQILKRMNLAFSCEENAELYLTVFDTISDLSEITVSDLRFTHQIRTETAKIMRIREKKETAEPKYIINDEKTYNLNKKKCEKFSDVIKYVSEGRVTSMFMVVQMLLDLYIKLNKIKVRLPGTDRPAVTNRQSRAAATEMCVEVGIFVKQLEEAIIDKKFQKISRQYLDIIIEAIDKCFFKYTATHLPRRNALSLLRSIRYSEKLSTYHENIIIKRGMVVNKEDSRVTKEEFSFSHPASAKACGIVGRCGFILKVRQDDDNFWSDELTVNPTDYEGTYRHCHGIISAQDMFRYTVMSAKTAKGYKIRTVGRWTKWWEEWFLGSTEWEIEGEFVAYNVADYRVTQCDNLDPYCDN
ncbi:hypothetical protein ACHWQZ_G010131 [Mnemiopsis leidyi]